MRMKSKLDRALAPLALQTPKAYAEFMYSILLPGPTWHIYAITNFMRKRSHPNQNEITFININYGTDDNKNDFLSHSIPFCGERMRRERKTCVQSEKYRVTSSPICHFELSSLVNDSKFIDMFMHKLRT